MTRNIFDTYWDAVAVLLGGRPTKRTAIRLSEEPPAKFNGADAVQRLYATLDCPGWQTPVGSNWVWRDEPPPYATNSPEVQLEREIVAADADRRWTCQMSTASGIQGPYRHKRRAIDLVRRNGPDRYSFIELKVDSDNPLYAAFEILGYGLVYQHARRHHWQGAGQYNLMDAQEIDLVVLGPHRWHEYRKGRRRPRRLVFDFEWLADALTAGLNTLSDDAPRMGFSFQRFEDQGGVRRTASTIVSRPGG